MGSFKNFRESFAAYLEEEEERYGKLATLAYISSGFSWPGYVIALWYNFSATIVVSLLCYISLMLIKREKSQNPLFQIIINFIFGGLCWWLVYLKV